MQTIAIIAQKGGVGKTTLALHLAVEAAGADTVAVIDLDPQASASGWSDSREGEEPAVVACPATRLNVTLEAARPPVPASPSSILRRMPRARRWRRRARPIWW